MTGQRPTGDRAVTPVVGIVLLLAVTVLLGATAGVYVAELSDDAASTSAPTAVFSFQPEFQSGGADSVTVEHRGGDSIAPGNLYVVVRGASCRGGPGTPDGRYNPVDDFGFGPDTVSAGATVRYGEDLDRDGTGDICTGGGTLDVAGARFRVVWESPTGTSRLLQRWTAP